MIPIRRRLYQSLAGFTPRQLFSALQGAWLEPVVGNIWQENTGVTPTTTGGQTIGLILDQSKGVVLGPELVTNGTFDSGTSGWNVSGQYGSIAAVGGELEVTSASTGLLVSTAFTSVVGRTYRLSGEARKGTFTGDVQFGFSGLVGGIPVVDFLGTLSDAKSTYSGFYTATTTTSYVVIRYAVLQPGTTTYFDNISVREILGNHASQSTAANRPTYQLDSNNLPLARHDATDSLTVSLPNLGGGVFSASGSVYFSTPVGMSALHNQNMGTSYTLPALSTDIYSWIVVPQRLNTALEDRLERYMLRKAGLAVPDYLTDDFGETITDDIGDPILAG